MLRKIVVGWVLKSLRSSTWLYWQSKGGDFNRGHDSLVYKVLKAKYFPTSDFSQAVLGNNPSFTWRSIMFAQPLVKYGLRWRLGNGERIRI